MFGLIALSGAPDRADAVLTVDTTACPAANTAIAILPSTTATSGSCGIGFSDSTGTATLRIYQQDGTGVAMPGVLDYASGSATWGIPTGPALGANVFGACLATATANVTPGWTKDTDASCSARDDDPWNGVPTTNAGAASLIGTTNVSGATGTVSVRFGARVPVTQAPGAYSAPVVFEVVSTVVNNAPSAPTLVTPAAAALTTATPSLVATFNDADTGQTGTISYEVRQQVTGACSTSGTLMGSGSSASVVAGANGTWNYSGTALVAGTTYCWRAMATDAASATSSWSSLQAFTVNSAPTAPTPTSPTAGGSATPTPTLTATYNDVDASQSGTASFEVRQQVTGACSTSGTLMGSGSSGSVTNGASASWSYSGTALVVGTTYCWRVMGTDALSATSAWSALQAFTVAAPSTDDIISGFELGTSGTQAASTGIEYFRTVNGTPTMDTSIVRTGDYSMKVDAPSENLMLDQTGGVNTAARFAIYFETMPTANTFLMYYGDWASNSWTLRFDAATSRLYTQVNTDPVTLGQVVTTGRWYVIDFGVDPTPPTFGINWRIDGVAQPSATSTLSAPGGAMTLQYLWLGVGAGGTGATIYYDDVADDDGAYPIGDGRVIGLRPNGTGTIVAGYQNDDGSAVTSSSWTRLIDNPMNSVLDYIRAASTSATVDVTNEDTPVASGAARGLRSTFMYHSSATSPNNATTSFIYNDASMTTIYSNDMSESTIFDSTKMIPPPAAGWTKTELDGAKWQLGPASDINPVPYWDALLLEADYAFTNTAPTAPTLVTPASGSTGVAATPTLTATFNDSDAEQNGRITFEVRAQVTGACSTSGTLMGSGTTTFDVAGANLSWTYSGSALSSATTYCWRAMSTDSSNATSAWSALRPFTRA